MADEFQATATICGSGGGAWWNSPMSAKFPSDNFVSPCFGAAVTYDFGSQENNIKSRITCTDNRIGFGQREADSDSGGSTVTIDSTMQMMGLGFSSNSTSNWNQTILQEDLNSSFIRTSQEQEHGQGFLSTTTSPYLLNPACSSSASSSSSLLPAFYEPGLNPYSFVSTTTCSINDPQVSWANNTTNPNHQAAYGLINNFSNNTNSRPFWSSSSTTNLSNTTQNSFVTTPQIISTRVEEKTKVINNMYICRIFMIYKFFGQQVKFSRSPFSKKKKKKVKFSFSFE
ncbi:unnamed protein product [Eruca vesicaria subsp. sativa]|uniref:Uncharacterized protein n=1 Tax=Eruca vesicaria subsp. sativa TaxID=29727 RepID=A0ABC8IVT8_ERUVS|nr:unnamed protein product [Eruca vesicaria subsp. sativa]